jgi:pimeloyl-ACP methyl ester carboxylesterase
MKVFQLVIRSLALVLGAAAAPVAAAASDEGIRPFKVNVPQSAIDDMRRRASTTRWPDPETVPDHSQGPRLAKVKALVDYWGRGYDWRKAEARLNALPQFITRIDGVDIHFIHVRSKHRNALPMMVSHGWPGSVFEQIKLIEPLTNPTAFGGSAADAFDVVIPSLPGFGFSSRPLEPSWGADRIARAWDVLMKRLGYTRYVAQGGDWGAAIVQAMGRQAPSGLLGIHTNLPATIPPDAGPALLGAPIPAGFSAEERATLEALIRFRAHGDLEYVRMMKARPQAVGYGQADSPAGLAGWMLVHPGFEHWKYGEDPTQSPTRDDVLDNFSLYWLTNTATSSSRLYWEHRGEELVSAAAQKTRDIRVPVAITAFPDEVYQPPESWARRAYPNLIYFRKADRGGHFAAWEHPELFSAEMRAAFRTLR